jgi:hypothetical protein
VCFRLSLCSELLLKKKRNLWVTMITTIHEVTMVNGEDTKGMNAEVRIAGMALCTDGELVGDVGVLALDSFCFLLGL